MSLRSCLILIALSAAPWVRGAVVAGGDGTQNTTAPAGFAYWKNIGYFPFGGNQTGGSGIYLGDRWVLTAYHVQGGNDSGYGFMIQGLNNGQDQFFTPVTSSQVHLWNPAGSAPVDLSLFRVEDDPLLHTLPNVQFGATPAVGSNILVTGSGWNRDATLHTWRLADPSQPDNTTWTDVTGQPNQGPPSSQRKGYYWTPPGFAKRWGTNTTVAMPGDGATFEYNFTSLFGSVFDNVTNDSQLAPGDSGGGVWVGNRLVGLNLYIGTDTKDPSNPNDVGQPANTAVFGNASFYADVYTYVDQIASITKLHPSIDGDANLDGTVDQSDKSILLANVGTGTKWTQGDFNLDGTVNFADYQILERGFGMTATFPVSVGANGVSMAGVPEPGVVGVAGVLAAMAGLGRRRR